MQKNIVETARDAGTFTTLIAAIDRAGLEPTMISEGPFTVFAPNDEAFAQLPEGTVDSLLAEPAKLAQVAPLRNAFSAATVSARIVSLRSGSAARTNFSTVTSPCISSGTTCRPAKIFGIPIKFTPVTSIRPRI